MLETSIGRGLRSSAISTNFFSFFSVNMNRTSVKHFHFDLSNCDIRIHYHIQSAENSRFNCADIYKVCTEAGMFITRVDRDYCQRAASRTLVVVVQNTRSQSTHANIENYNREERGKGVEGGLRVHGCS